MEEIVLEMDIVSLIRTTFMLNRIQDHLLRADHVVRLIPQRLKKRSINYQVAAGRPDVSVELDQWVSVEP